MKFLLAFLLLISINAFAQDNEASDTSVGETMKTNQQERKDMRKGFRKDRKAMRKENRAEKKEARQARKKSRKQ